MAPNEDCRDSTEIDCYVAYDQLVHQTWKQDLARLAGRTRCYDCREVRLFSRNCPKKNTSHYPSQSSGSAPCNGVSEGVPTAEVLGVCRRLGVQSTKRGVQRI